LWMGRHKTWLLRFRKNQALGTSSLYALKKYESQD
jgi:hypothetical protein